MLAQLEGSTIELRRLQPGDIAQVIHLLKDLPQDYPRGDLWLKRRLREALADHAKCEVASVAGVVAGVVILTPKQSSMKLSTIMVAERFRGLGIGSRLMDLALEITADEGFDETFVTVAEHTFPLLRPLLKSRGFTRLALERHRYGLGRHELVFTRLS